MVLKTAGLLSVACDVHPWMKGYIFVYEHPYYTITDSVGHFIISGIPPGDYMLSLWRDNWNVNEVKDAEGRIQSYQWGSDFSKKLPVHIESRKNLEVNFTLP